MSDNLYHSHFEVEKGGQSMQDAYEHKGKPLDTAIAQELITKYFWGRRIRTKALEKEVDQLHISRGGLESDDDTYKHIGPVARALTNLARSHDATNKISGMWQIGFDLPEHLIIHPNPKTIGEGDSYVYLYYLLNDRSLAESKGKSIFACKIGMTEDKPSRSLWRQVQGLLSSEPRIALIIKTDFPSVLKQCIHDVLKAFGRYRENQSLAEWFYSNLETLCDGELLGEAPGVEWFYTNPAEVEGIYYALQPILQDNQ